jgi:hypothetical protein
LLRTKGLFWARRPPSLRFGVAGERWPEELVMSRYGWCVIVTALVLLCGLGCGMLEPPLPQEVVRHELMLAVQAVEFELTDLEEGSGYRRWKASAAVDEVIPVLNATTSPLSELEHLPEVRARIRYVRDTVSSPWQVVLQPRDELNLIRIDGYGQNTRIPVYSKYYQI